MSTRLKCKYAIRIHSITTFVYNSAALYIAQLAVYSAATSFG